MAMAVIVENTDTAQRVAQKARVYVLVTVAQGFTAEVASVLRSKPGVVAADVVEGEPSVIMVVEARHRLELAHLTIQALAAVEIATVGLRLMPADGY
jgi:hypothetical protein